MHCGSGKNSKLRYYAGCLWREAVPGFWLRWRLKRVLARARRRKDWVYIERRVNYYCRLNAPVVLPADSPRLGEHTRKGMNSVYYFDTKEFTRWFDPELRWRVCPGDVTYVPEWPAVVKSRPIAAEEERAANAFSVLLNLDKIRHFTFLKDRMPFRRKLDRAIFRGDVNRTTKPHRVRFMERYFGSEICDCGIISSAGDCPEEWMRPKISLWEHLKYKFVMTLEGNDVASNLKWVMSSNSLAVMPRPKYETWFMEGTLVPGYHYYVEIRDDFSDLPEKMAYYAAHPEEAERIAAHAHEYIAQFRNKRRERIISLLVLEKYFRMTGQLIPETTERSAGR